MRLEFKLLCFCALVGIALNFSEVSAAPVSFSNTNFINLDENSAPPNPAVPYPSTNFVSGLAGQLVRKATVTLQDFSHTFPSDATILLVGPRGQEAILMANAGGQDQHSVTDLTITFDDDATNALPIYTALTNGVFQPTNGYVALGFSSLQPGDLPPPAPPGNSNAPAALSVFKNTDPNGTWNLFIVDDSEGDYGSISNGWSLNLTMAAPLYATSSGTNFICSWPQSATNCTLQFSPDVSASTWTNFPTKPVINGGQLTITNPITGRGSTFYRLINN